jgi:CheY-like chemotaxis protein
LKSLNDEQFKMSATSIAIALVVSHKAATIATLSECLRKFDIATETCSHNDEAVSLINRKKFEAVIIDSHLNGSRKSLLDAVRCSRSNRSAVTFAISDRAAQERLLRETPTFLLATPLSRAALDKAFNESFGMIVLERRRYFRCPALVAGMLSVDGSDTCNCQVVNISEGGIRLITFKKLYRGSVVEVRFGLPGTSSTQDVRCEVCWGDPSGRAAGLRFLSQSAVQKAELQTWITRRLESILPERLLDKFRLGTKLSDVARDRPVRVLADSYGMVKATPERS